MSENQSVTGKCLCGQVTVKAQAASNQVHACHCNMCRRWSGGPALAVDCQTQVTFEGENNITVFDSSEWAQRGFCRQCGTHVFYRIKESGQYIMPVGLFDDLKKIEFEGQIFVDEKPGYYEFSNQTSMMTGAEVFAVFADPQGH